MWVAAFLVAPVSAQSFEDSEIARAFEAHHDGYSSDEVLIRDDLRNRFLDALAADRGDLDAGEQRAALLHLLKLRKAGKLSAAATRRGLAVDEAVLPIAEIAARVVTDRHRVTTDTMLCDPEFRRELQHEAELIFPGADAYAIRKAVLALRKRRSLRPELVLKVADWGREVRTLSLNDLREAIRLEQVPANPGVYLFRSPIGYLYVGEASNLAARLREHTSGSDRKSLAEYLAGEHSASITVELHIFPPDSPAAKVGVRRAYESELIRSRQPKFNVRP